MQDLFSSNTTLLDAETILESFFVNDGQEHIVTHRINLSPNDAYHIMESFNSIQYAELDFYMKVKLAIVVGWIFSKKYGIQHRRKDFFEDIKEVPQHHLRFYLDLIGSTFEEFNIPTFGHNYYSFDGICAIIDILSCL